jgi:hypothetical protein
VDRFEEDWYASDNNLLGTPRLKTQFLYGPEDDLFIRSKHVAFYVINLVVLDV